MVGLEARVTRLEEKVDSMDADAKGHFAEMRGFIAEQGARLDRKITWVIALVLIGIAVSLASLLVAIPG